MGPSNTFHAPQDCEKTHNHHANYDTRTDINLQKAAKNDTDTSHLSRYVGEGDKDSRDRSDNAGDIRVIAIADKIRYGILAELAQIG